MSDYDDRPDWREIDRRRDKSRHYGRPYEKAEKKTNPNADRWITAKRKEAINRLLKGEKGTIEHDRLLNKIHSSYGTGSFLNHVKKYMDKYGVPDDISALLLILDGGNIQYAMEAMEKLKEMAEGLSSRERQDIKTKLNIIKMTHRSTEMKEKAKEILEAIESVG